MNSAKSSCPTALHSAWGLLFVSLTAMGAAFAAIDARDWPAAAAMVLVMALTAWAAGAERAEHRRATGTSS